MKQVCRDDVFIGDRGDALDCLTQAQGKGKGIRQILTIDCEPLRQPLGSNSAKVNGDILLKHVECLDEPEADLLSHLDNCIGSIQEGLKKGKVLVHCFAGVSRSATVILAFLMQTQNIELKKAFEDLKAVYPKADPNPGFLYQLQLFEAMGKRVDTASSLYKQFRLQIIARRLEKTGGKQLPDGILESFAHNPERSVVDSKQNVYKCRKCRYQLFQTTNCLQHIPGTGQAFLPWYSKSLIQEDQKVSRSNCTSYFIEPVKWMMPLLVATAEGKVWQ